MFRKKSFKGGAHPHDEKSWSADMAIQEMPVPERVIIPVQQHIGAPGDIIVEKGESVKKGQPLTKTSKFVSVPVHASISGTIQAVEKRPHPFGTNLTAIVIESDGNDAWANEPKLNPDHLSLNPDKMIQMIGEAGIAGMGGAAFPSHVKLSPPAEKPIDTLILNGVECEPYLTSDYRLMLEQPDDILAGLRILMKILGLTKASIGIEENKPKAISLLKEKCSGKKNIAVVPLAVKYPQGAEKQLIKAVTGREVPSGGLPMDVGCLVHNVGTAVAIYEAVAMGKPLIERIVTVTGPGVRKPRNLKARIGTPFSDMIEFCGGYTQKAAKVINGGPMMGIAQVNIAVPVIKGTSGILVLDERMAAGTEELPCISCARCVDVCPMKLLPNHIASFIEHNRVEEAQKLGLFDCMECSTCSFICPAKRNLVHYIKLGKALWNEAQKKTG